MAHRRSRSSSSLLADPEVRKGLQNLCVLLVIPLTVIGWFVFQRYQAGRLEQYYTLQERPTFVPGQRSHYAFNIILEPAAADDPELRPKVIERAFRIAVRNTPSQVYMGYVYRRGDDPMRDPAMSIHLYSRDGKDWDGGKEVERKVVINVTP